MNPYKKHTPEYLSFTRKERIGIGVIVVLIVIFIVVPFLFPFFTKPKPADHKAFEKEIAELKMKEPDSSKRFTKKIYEDDNAANYYQPSEKNYYSNQPKGELFYFDPNTLPVAGWVKLGVREKTANTIQKYIAKGGKFYKPEDIAKIWGLHEDEIKRLMPYVRIEGRPTNGSVEYKNAEPPKTYEKQKYAVANVDINEADTSAFIALPGIGSKLANRIIAFREKLGGFYKVEQVAETYALPDSTFQKIKDKLVIKNRGVKKLNINTATLDELKIHPYLRYNIANAIVQYRTQHGDFSAVADIKKIMLITDEIFDKAVPYLTIK
ncbi:MAG: helix-hairpin-helix domain-containing protein [Ferruginibacter sp.]